MNNFERCLKILQEEFYGNQAIVYHRTYKPLEEIESNFTKGMKPGSGIYYGSGIYANYELEDCFTIHSLKYYGPTKSIDENSYIIKCKVNIHGFIILDYDIAKQVYKDNYTLVDQFKLLNIPTYPYLNIDSSKLETTKNSSEILLRMYMYIQDNCNGVIYTGKLDNRCLLSYEPKLVIPIAVTKANTTIDDVEWHTLNSKHTIRQYLSVIGIKKTINAIDYTRFINKIKRIWSQYEIKVEDTSINIKISTDKKLVKRYYFDIMYGNLSDEMFELFYCDESDISKLYKIASSLYNKIPIISDYSLDVKDFCKKFPILFKLYKKELIDEIERFAMDYYVDMSIYFDNGVCIFVNLDNITKSPYYNAIITGDIEEFVNIHKNILIQSVDTFRFLFDDTDCIFVNIEAKQWILDNIKEK